MLTGGERKKPQNAKAQIIVKFIFIWVDFVL
jgi:hypothetical protein